MNIADLATWLGAVVALVSAVFSVWYPWHNRARASWFIQKLDWSEHVEQAFKLGYFTSHTGRSKPDMVLVVCNDGDGVGYNVMVDVDGGECCIFHNESFIEGFDKLSELPNVPVANPQESFTVAVWADDPDTVVLRIEWTVQPTHLHKRVYVQYALKGEIEPQPRYPIPVPRDHAPWLWWYRLSHWMRDVLNQVRSSH